MNSCDSNCSPNNHHPHANRIRIVTSREAHMLFIVAALALMGVLLGAAAHTPLPLFLTAAGAISAWLLVFFIRERTGRKES
ncbi:hypothetical protein ACFRNT_38570 [Streptomyces sp. NPDC056697]|uniref:hypothetical protein n=2 Tax=unclassified Streptomyces TaxID=2593676 RepID=UPI00368E50EF